MAQQRSISGNSYQMTKISGQFLISGQFQDNFKISGISRISGQLGALNTNSQTFDHVSLKTEGISTVF